MTHSKISSFLLLLMSLGALKCSDDDVTTRSYPSIDTKAVTEINQAGATLHAEILNIGSSSIIDHGFIYGDVPPTLDNSDRISLGETLQKGVYSALVNTNLVKDKKYYVKAYAITRDKNFIVYGQSIEFISQGGSAPEIKDFSPKQGSIGDTVILSGSGFSNVSNNNRISFGVINSTVVKATNDSLWCIVPANTLIGENQISLKLGQVNENIETKFFLKPITLTSFDPTSVSFGDTISIDGLNFPLQKSLITATLLGKDVAISSASSTKLKMIVANTTSIVQSLITLKAGVQTITSVDNIKLLQPIITNFSPTKGTKDTEVVIQGNYFSPIKENNKVNIDAFALTVTEASKSTLKVKIPSGISPGKYPLTITVATQSVNTSSQIEIIKPIINNVSPLSGTWGTTITLSGENFGNSTNDNRIMFDNVQATIISASSTEIKVLVPNNLLKKVSNISLQAISVDNLTSVYNIPFTLNAPVITSFSSYEGKSRSQITINGNNFNPISNNQIVKFGDHLVEVISSTPSQLLVQLPTSLIDSDVYIQIDVAEQTAVSPSIFHLISPWRRIADFAGTPRTDAVSYAIGSYGFVGLGTNHLADIYQYDPANNAWSPIKDFSYFSDSSSYYVNSTSFVIENEAYVGLGYTGAPGITKRSEFSKYNAWDNKWYDVADIGSAQDGIESAVGFSINGYGYVTSGHSNQANFKMLQYDPGSDAWNRKTDFPGPPRTEASGFSIGNKAYLIAGRNYLNTNLYNDLWVYDTTLDSWNQLTSIPGSARYQSTAFSINGIGYLIGGAFKAGNGINLLKDFWMYDPVTNNWVGLEDFPGEARVAGTAFVVNGKAYYGTGSSLSNPFLKDFWEFDPAKL